MDERNIRIFMRSHFCISGAGVIYLISLSQRNTSSSFAHLKKWESQAFGEQTKSVSLLAWKQLHLGIAAKYIGGSGFEIGGEPLQ